MPPLSEHGNVMEINEMFGEVETLREAVTHLPALPHAA